MARICAELFAFSEQGMVTNHAVAAYETPGDVLIHMMCQRNNPACKRAVVMIGGVATSIEFSGERKPFRPPSDWDWTPL